MPIKAVKCDLLNQAVTYYGSKNTFAGPAVPCLHPVLHEFCRCLLQVNFQSFLYQIRVVFLSSQLPDIWDTRMGFRELTDYLKLPPLKFIKKTKITRGQDPAVLNKQEVIWVHFSVSSPLVIFCRIDFHLQMQHLLQLVSKWVSNQIDWRSPGVKGGKNIYYCLYLDTAIHNTDKMVKGLKGGFYSGNSMG